MENKTLRDSAAIRWTALLLLALAMFCAYIFVDILSPIKDLMQSQRGWDSDAFGTMQGSETFLNVFIFFLIFAGIILDKMGVRFTAPSLWWRDAGGRLHQVVRCQRRLHRQRPGDLVHQQPQPYSVFEQLGVSPFYEGMPASAKLAAIGFMLFGCGTEMAGITVLRGYREMVQGPRDGTGHGIRDGIGPSLRTHG